MSRRRDPNKTVGVSDQFDVDSEINEMLGTVKVLGQVSKAIGEEIEDQNRLLAQMSARYQQASAVIRNVVDSVKRLLTVAGMSPMTLTMLFVVGVVVFLWFYWKIRA